MFSFRPRRRPESINSGLLSSCVSRTHHRTGMSWIRSLIYPKLKDRSMPGYLLPRQLHLHTWLAKFPARIVTDPLRSGTLENRKTKMKNDAQPCFRFLLVKAGEADLKAQDKIVDGSRSSKWGERMTAGASSFHCHLTRAVWIEGQAHFHILICCYFSSEKSKLCSANGSYRSDYHGCYILQTIIITRAEKRPNNRVEVKDSRTIYDDKDDDSPESTIILRS